MSFTLNALFVEIDNKFKFYRYFWDGMDAFYCGESSAVLIDNNIKGYRLETHKISDFDIHNEDAYYKLAKNYELISIL